MFVILWERERDSCLACFIIVYVAVAIVVVLLLLPLLIAKK